MGPRTVFRKGERVRAAIGDESCDAVVALASRNGRSLIITFEAILGGCVGMAPIGWSDELGQFVVLFVGTEITLTRGGTDAHADDQEEEARET